ncbi:unnamed protein product [Amoebophrya sp. A25]|nr:unnamed protein product [Amoebophrya sp. A25]|eukprot:GSA25T00009672001.1
MAPTFAEGTGFETKFFVSEDDAEGVNKDLQDACSSTSRSREVGETGVVVGKEVGEHQKTPNKEEQSTPRVYCATVDAAFYMPWAGEFSQRAGLVTAWKGKLIKNLNQKKSIGLYPGGADEALLSGGGKMRIILKKRVGFIDCALQTGTPLVPVLIFGETALFRQTFNTKLRAWQHQMQKFLSFSLPSFGNARLEHSCSERFFHQREVDGNGKFAGGCSSSSGSTSGSSCSTTTRPSANSSAPSSFLARFPVTRAILPMRVPLHTVFGAPIPIPQKMTDPKAEAYKAERERLHALYIEKVKELHAKWKHLGSAEDQELEIVSAEESRSAEMLEALKEGRWIEERLKERIFRWCRM